LLFTAAGDRRIASGTASAVIQPPITNRDQSKLAIRAENRCSALAAALPYSSSDGAQIRSMSLAAPHAGWGRNVRICRIE
jgi:hypothetical protein